MPLLRLIAEGVGRLRGSISTGRTAKATRIWAAQGCYRCSATCPVWNGSSLGATEMPRLYYGAPV